MQSKQAWEEQAKRWSRLGFSMGAQAEGVEVWEHCAPGYSKRTEENAQSDVTVAIAADYSTGGERLTAQMAGKQRYLALPFYLDEEEAGRRLAEFMRERGAKSLNIAGNGIYTLSKKGWSQEAANQWVFDCLASAKALGAIERVHTGGQTGIDISGAIAARRLELPVRVLMPKGYKQRGEDARDVDNDPRDILEAIERGAGALLPWPRSLDRTPPKP